MKARRVTDVFRLAAALLCGTAPVAAGAADRIAIKIDVIGPLGMRVLEMHSLLEAEENPGRYAVSVDYATTGLAGMVIDQKTYAVAHGQLIPGSAVPASFRNHTSRNGVERDSQVRYSVDGAVQGSSNPPPSNTVAPTAARGTVDNLSAYLRLERQLATKGTCAMTVPVFGTVSFGSFHGDSANGSTPTANCPEPKQPSVWKTKFVSVFPPACATNWIVGL